MIKYRLKCGGGHEFEAWFVSSTAYESQEAEGRLVCPHCARTDVERAVMAPRVSTQRTRDDAHLAAPARSPEFHPPEPATVALRPGHAEGEKLHAMLREMRSLRDKILANSEYVGPSFAEEARKIQHKEAAERAIHGEATPEDIRELADDGIDILLIPRLPDDLN